MTHLPAYQFDFGPGLSVPRGRALCRVQSPGATEVVEQSFSYRFNDTSLLRDIGAILSPPLADALDTSAIIYLADRYAPRAINGSRQWHRRIHVQIPVRQAVLWRDDRVARALEAFLAFLTDDEWSIAFVPRTAPRRRTEQQAVLLPNGGGRPASLAVLQSGGLDSCLGIIDAAIRHPYGSILAVSVVSHSHPSTVQRAVVTSIRRGISADIVWARLHVGLSGVHRDHQESSQRARGFLYLMTGAVAAALGGASMLQVAENGIGAINLPLAPDQLGTHTTRAMHPVTLARFEELMTVLFGQPLTVRNVGLWQTKAELCRQVLGSTDDDTFFADAACRTISCDRFPWIGLRQACGCCTSCLFRRLSLLAADRRDLDTNAIRGYAFDPLSATADWSAHDLTPLYMLRSQAAQLHHALQAPEPFSALVEAFPSLMRIYHATAHLGLTERELQERLVRLYQAYVAEWDQFDRFIHWPPTGASEPIAITDPAVLAAIAS